MEKIETKSPNATIRQNCSTLLRKVFWIVGVPSSGEFSEIPLFIVWLARINSYDCRNAM